MEKTKKKRLQHHRNTTHVYMYETNNDWYNMHKLDAIEYYANERSTWKKKQTSLVVCAND